ncbi:hypothetical protein ACLB6G_20365 [Zhengella sp. ZM62]|uniref:hypothetical protein n=1 Tax=Zhengella sedimenti TaxID=3390035 RepID=UPI0039767B67
MTYDYTRPEATAQRLIAKFGQSVTLTKVTKVWNDWNPGVNLTEYSATGAVMDYADREIDGTVIKAGDKRVYLSTEGLTVEPDTTDTLTVGGVVHSIIRVDPLNPGGTVVMWTLQVRR